MPAAFADQDLHACNALGLQARGRVALLEDEADIPALCAIQARGGAPAHGPQRQRAEAPAALTAPLFVLGAGSNVVMQAHPRHRIVRVGLRGIRLWRETSRHWIVEAAAGEPWHAFVAHCLAQGWPGLENLALIPGTVGAAPVQNIGAYGLELDRRLHSVVAWDLQTARAHELQPADCGFAYRDSLFKRAGPGCWLIVRVRFALPKAWTPILDYPDLQDHPLLAASRVGHPAFTDRHQASTSGHHASADGHHASTDGHYASTDGHHASTDRHQAVAAGNHARLGGHQALQACLRPSPTPQQIFDAVCEIRRRKLPDPTVLGNAGSFFKNPVVAPARAHALRARFPELRAYPQADGTVKLAAGWLIEQAGWKGRRLGPVGMHERQALVLVNHGGAQAADVLALARAVCADVRAKFGIELEREPVLLD